MSALPSDLHTETLAEVFNIAMGRAARAMSNLINEEVALTIPLIKMVHRHEAPELLGGAQQRVYSITQVLEGDFRAYAILIFPEAKSMDLVRLTVGDIANAESITELEREALTELGNIILNACIGTVTNLLEGNFRISLPVFRSSTCGELLRPEPETSQPEDMVLLLHIDFCVEKHAINGHVAFIQDIVSFRGLMDRIDQFIAKAVHGT